VTTHVSYMMPDETLPILREVGYHFSPFITLAHLFNAPKAWTMPPRTFFQYHMQYVVDGEAYYRVENQTYHTKAGDLILHEPYQEHETIVVADSNYVCISVTFHFGDVRVPMMKILGAHEPYLGNFLGSEVADDLFNLATAYHQPGVVHQLQCQHLVLGIFAKVAECFNVRRGHDKGKGNAVLVLVRNYLEEHYADHITYEDLLALCQWSRNYLTQQFSAAYGVTPYEYLTWIRVQQAKKLAIQTCLSISEIANRVGFSDVHTFGRMFKRKTGSSLSEFCSSVVVSSSDAVGNY